MTDYKEKFLEAEQQASMLVKQLEQLKQEAINYNNSKVILEDAREQIVTLISDITALSQDMQQLIKAVHEISTEKILEDLGSNKMVLMELNKDLDFYKPLLEQIPVKIIHNKESIEAGNKAFKDYIRRLSFFIYVIIGLNVIIGILVVLLK